ncbi:MAG: cupredoxin domain-containing protein [Anaerolineae bacterium]|nr:cupredoxin domain-containing protein [Anaerolineae bacterium]
MMQSKVLFSVVFVLLLSACAGPSQPGTEISVEAIDFAYQPLSITIPAGQPVTLTLKNSGKVEHDFVIEKINVTDVEASDSGPAEHHQMRHAPEFDLHFFARAGETETLQFTALEPGTYEIFCSIEGHKEAGMTGELIVANQE